MSATVCRVRNPMHLKASPSSAAGLLLRHELRQLPAPRRDVLQLMFYDEMSHAQLAEHLGRPPGTVKSVLRRSYAHMRPMLQAYR